MVEHLIPENFNPDHYMLAYPDVAKTNLAPEEHYIKYGKLLGRDPNPYPQARQTSLQETSPALLDLRYAHGILPKTKPIRHEELVSILMPSHNNEQWLARALSSALSQQGVNVEVILIDDGSTDGSVKVAHQISSVAPNLKVISLLRNFGCYYARNIGVMNSSGEFITILDSDDIMEPDRISRQLDALKAAPSAIACRCRQRRWSQDYTIPLSDLKYGENSLIWRREVIDQIGFYDTVRYGADSEFRLRLQRAYGVEKVIKIPDELYYTRTVSGSLTINEQSGVFKYSTGQLVTMSSPPRQAYEKHFTDWQKRNKPHLSISFPQFSRSFDLGAEDQNASPSLGQRRIGAMASFPARRNSLKAVLERIVPQLDELRLYLNDYEEVPEFVHDPKIRVTLGRTADGDLRDNGKFYDLLTEDDAYIFTLDDDLVYPDDYVSRMIHYIEMLGRSSVVGVHGVIFPENDFTELAQREVFLFKEKRSGHFVDLLGTGTAAWHNSSLRPELNEFGSRGVCDLWFALAAAKRNIPMFSVPREANWLREQTRHEFSLYKEAIAQPAGYFEVYQRYLAPILKSGRLRKEITSHLSHCYDKDTLAAAGITITDSVGQEASPLIQCRRPASIVAPLPSSIISSADTSSPEELHFHIVVNGWNCKKELASCLRSIAQQRPASYSFDATLLDDGSDDGTYQELLRTAILPHAEIIRVSANTGPAHARHIGIKAIKDSNAIVVLLDMDDALEPHALSTVAQRYRNNPACLLTYGNWHDQYGKKNPQRFYTPEEIDAQSIRTVELFNATALRTFRRHLYDAVEVPDLLDHEGNWLETCTDVALMYPLIDQCRSYEVEVIDEPIYRYTRKHSSGTLARFGKPHKVERLNWLKSKPPKPRPVKDWKQLMKKEEIQ